MNGYKWLQKTSYLAVSLNVFALMLGMHDLEGKEHLTFLQNNLGSCDWQNNFVKKNNT